LAKRRVDRYSNVGAFASALAALAPRSSHVSVGRITRVLANAGTLQDLADALPATDRSSPPTESNVSIDVPANTAPRAGSETRPGSPQAMAAETAQGGKTMASDAPGEAKAEPPAQNVATAAPWSSTSSDGSSRAKLGIRIGAVVAAVSGLVIYISTGRPAGEDSATTSAAAEEAPSMPSAAAGATPASAVHALEAPSSVASAATASGAPSASPQEPPPAVSAVVPAPAGAKLPKAAPSAVPRPAAKPTAPVAAKPQPSAKPAATPGRPAGLFDDRR
jgi:hypothetical protein